ncbi:helix-turn-helix domain-containing protein [Phytoactinopolyspora halotolerans]|uniref:helix-turn-helix domain-containing protein n=1 Tax=Phytoactinopolyspora halotolerans TaxID=1981512 RepID=UPI001C209B91|nr:XRE family transcriptional regulator [Phytoactinopolyspora halotolerans]
MSDDDLNTRLAATVHHTRTARGLSVSVLAERSGVSRAMIGKIERGDVQPTAALLARLAAALELTLSELIAHAEGNGRRLARADEQPVWSDPDSGYRRRAVSPPGNGPLELVEVELPPGTHLAMIADTHASIHRQLWMLEGHLELHEDDDVHHLGPGDCLQLGDPASRTFINSTPKPCRYLVALCKHPR